MANGTGYTVIRQTHINQLDRNSGEVVPGWEITVQDGVTGTSVPVFVPDANYSPEGAAAAIEHVLTQVRGVHTLGQ